MGARRPGTGSRGFGFVEILVVLVVLALGGVLLLRYVGSTQKTVEKFQQDRPFAHARLMAVGIAAGTPVLAEETPSEGGADDAAKAAEPADATA